jgi:hypothetical protein
MAPASIQMEPRTGTAASSKQTATAPYTISDDYVVLCVAGCAIATTGCSADCIFFAAFKIDDKDDRGDAVPPLPVNSQRLRPFKLRCSGMKRVPCRAPPRISTIPSGFALVQITRQQPAAVAMRAAVSFVTMPPVPHCVPVVLVSAVREEMSSTSWIGVALGSIWEEFYANTYCMQQHDMYAVGQKKTCFCGITP